MKKLLLSTMLVATTVGGFSETVWSRTLVGQSDWSVRKIAADTPYCTLARQFEAGAVMTVARNARGEGTIALDFKRDAFDITRPYPVVLQAGGLRREYAVKPAVSSVIVLRIGEDASLLQAMKDSDVLNVTIDTEQFALDLSGYDPAFDEMYECLGIASPQKTRSAQARPQPQPSLPPQISAGQTEKIDELLAENKRLTQELLARDRQQQDMVRQQVAAADRTAETQQLIQRLEQSESRNVQLLTQIEKLEADLLASRQSLNPDLSQVLKERDAQIAQLTAQNKSLKTALDEAQAELARLANVSQESAAMRERLARMETQAAALKAERDAFQRELAVSAGSSEEIVNNLQKRLNDLQQKIIETNAEKEQYQQRLQVAQQGSQSQVSELQSQLAQMEEQIATFKAERDSYQQQLQTVSSSSDQETATMQQRIAQLKGRIDTLSAEKEQYQQRLQLAQQGSQSQVSELQSQLAQMEEQIATFKAERDSYQRQLQSVTSGSAQETAQMQQRIAELESRIAAQTREKARFETEMQNMRETTVQGSAAMRREMQALENRLIAFKAERDQYQAQLNAKTKELSALQSRQPEVVVKEVIKEVPAALPDMAAPDAEIKARLAEAEAAARSYQAERDEFRRLLQQERMRASAADAPQDTLMADEMSRLQAEKAVMERELAAMQAGARQGKAAREEAEALKRRLRETEARLADANDRARRLEEKVVLANVQEQSAMSAQGNTAMLEARLKDMEAQMTSINASKASMEEELRRYKNDSANTGMDSSRQEAIMTARIQDMQDMLTRTKAEKQQLREELNAMRKDMVERQQKAEDYSLMAARLQDMEDRLNRVLKQKSEVEAKLAMTQTTGRNEPENNSADMNALSAQMKLLEEQVAMLNKEKATLTDKLAKASEAVDRPPNPRIRALLGQATRRVQDLEREMQAMAEANASLKEQLVNTRQAPVIAGRQDVHRVIQELATDEVQQDRQAVKSLQSEIAALEAQNSVLMQDVASYKQSAESNAKIAIVSAQQAEQAKRLRAKVQNSPQPEIKAEPVRVQNIQIEGLEKIQGMTQTGQKSMVALSGDEIRQLVMRASLPLSSGIDRIDRVSGPDFAAFRWDTGVVYGSGEQSRLSKLSAFDKSVQQYIDKTRSRCNGTFDQSVTDQIVDGVKVRMADIACVDSNGNGAGASVLFFTHRGMFYALAHEADMDTFQTAMDMRDRLLNSVSTIF